MPKRVNVDQGRFPVACVFDVLDESEFLDALSSFSEGVGVSHEESACDFPGELAAYDVKPIESYGYIEFWASPGEQTVRIGFAEFLYYTRQAVESEINSFPQNKQTLIMLLVAIENKIIELERLHLLYLARHIE